MFRNVDDINVKFMDRTVVMRIDRFHLLLHGFVRSGTQHCIQLNPADIASMIQPMITNKSVLMRFRALSRMSRSTGIHTNTRSLILNINDRLSRMIEKTQSNKNRSTRIKPLASIHFLHSWCNSRYRFGGFQIWVGIIAVPTDNNINYNCHLDYYNSFNHMYQNYNNCNNYSNYSNYNNCNYNYNCNKYCWPATTVSDMFEEHCKEMINSSDKFDGGGGGGGNYRNTNNDWISNQSIDQIIKKFYQNHISFGMTIETMLFDCSLQALGTRFAGTSMLPPVPPGVNSSSWYLATSAKYLRYRNYYSHVAYHYCPHARDHSKTTTINWQKDFEPKLLSDVLVKPSSCNFSNIIKKFKFCQKNLFDQFQTQEKIKKEKNNIVFVATDNDNDDDDQFVQLCFVKNGSKNELCLLKNGNESQIIGKQSINVDCRNFKYYFVFSSIVCQCVACDNFSPAGMVFRLQT